MNALARVQEMDAHRRPDDQDDILRTDFIWVNSLANSGEVLLCWTMRLEVQTYR